MNKLLIALNLCLLAALAGLGLWNVSLWTSPPYPDRVDGAAITTAAKPPPTMPVDRKPYSANTVQVTREKNLFQESRRSHAAPEPVVAEVAAAPPETPPPNLTLRGVILMDGRQVALLEGTYAVAQPNAPVTQKPLVHKGYEVGQKIGDYKITRIEKTGITLAGAKGEELKLKLTKFPAEQLKFPEAPKRTVAAKSDSKKSKNSKAASTKTTRKTNTKTPAKEAGK